MKRGSEIACGKRGELVEGRITTGIVCEEGDEPEFAVDRGTEIVRDEGCEPELGDERVTEILIVWEDAGELKGDGGL